MKLKRLFTKIRCWFSDHHPVADEATYQIICRDCGYVFVDIG